MAQSQTDSILVIKKWGTVYLQKEQNLSIGNLLYITKNNPEAFKEMKKAQTCLSLSFLTGCAGGIGIGYPIVVSLGGSMANWNYAYAGIALIGGSIALQHGFNVHATRGANLHNNSLPAEKSSCPTEWQLGMSPADFHVRFLF